MDDINLLQKHIKEVFQDNLGNPSKLSTLIDKFLIPQELEKKQNAEVSTPYILRNEILDTIPFSFWKGKMKMDKKTFNFVIDKKTGKPKLYLPKIFEPCSGKGGFLVDIVQRLMLGLTDFIPDEEERYKRILEECLYFSDINPMNIYICSLLLDPNNKYKLNSNEGDTLKLDIENKWGIKGFDAVVGNPPYQETDIITGKTKGGTNLYTKFMNMCFGIIKKNGFLTFITPISFIGPSKNKQMGGDILHNIFLKYDVLYFNLNECRRHFNVGSTFSYYTIQKRISKNFFTKITSKLKKETKNSSINLKKYFHLNFLPIHLTLETLKIIYDVTSCSNKLKIERCRVLDTSRKGGNPNLSLIQNDEYKYITYHTTTKTYYSKIKLDIYESKKILLNMAGYLKPKMREKCNITESKFYIIVNKNNENEILSLLQSENVKKYLELCKYSGFNSRKVLECITY